MHTAHTTRRFGGYAALFGVPDNGRDLIVRGAFARTLAAGPRPLLWQHDAKEPIGRIVAAREDPRGLYVEGVIAGGAMRGRDALALLEVGALTGLSIGYRVLQAGADRTRGLRLIEAAELVEISLVTFPMQPRAGVTQLAG
jgi:uncharacterized protein